MASATRSKSAGLNAVVSPADRFPGTFLELISTTPSQPLTGRRTIAPSLLIKPDSADRHTSFTVWPARANFLPRNDP
jgi:hypothetical protein